MKKIVSFILSIVTVFALAIPCFAATVDSDSSFPAEDFSQNYNVTPVSPWTNISTRGANPPTEGWNVNAQGPYHFSGKAAYSTLYLSKLLYGADYYTVIITNRSSSNTLTVNPQDGIPTDPFTVAPLTTTTPAKRFMEKPGKTYFGLTFNAPSDFEGVVGEYTYQ